MYIKLISGFTLLCFLFSTNLVAQEKDKKEIKKSLSVGTNGIKITNEAKVSKDDEKEDVFTIRFGSVDIGVNSLQDQTNYNSTAAQQFLDVPQASMNENLFDLNTGKSINVNVWVTELGWNLTSKSKRQKVLISTGIGLQMYNFRFNKQITYINETTPSLYIDTVVKMSKNKLGFTYLSMPLNLTFKTRAGKKTWLVYGVGITGGYRIASWTKQISDLYGKRKNRDPFNFNDFNACVTGQVGVNGYLRLYATYQVTPLHENALEQYPLCIGIRIGGI